MVMTNADNIRGKLAIKISIGREDPLLKWTEQLPASMVQLKISHEVEIIGGLAHDLRIDVQVRALRYAVDHFTLPQPQRGHGGQRQGNSTSITETVCGQCWP
jgi:hypothetical protein